MNSSQRRTQERKFPHVIRMSATSRGSYFEHDDNVMLAYSWCKCNCKKGYKVDPKWDTAEFKFVSERDAVIFALKWL